MTTSPSRATKDNTGPRKKPAKTDSKVVKKSGGSDPGTSDGPKTDKGLSPQGVSPALANESGGSDPGTSDGPKTDKGL